MADGPPRCLVLVRVFVLLQAVLSAGEEVDAARLAVPGAVHFLDWGGWAQAGGYWSVVGVLDWVRYIRLCCIVLCCIVLCIAVFI